MMPLAGVGLEEGDDEADEAEELAED